MLEKQHNNQATQQPSNTTTNSENFQQAGMPAPQNNSQNHNQNNNHNNNHNQNNSSNQNSEHGQDAHATHGRDAPWYERPNNKQHNGIQARHLYY